MTSLDEFICEYVIKRTHSMFLGDIESNTHIIAERIKDKTFLVIGGAGSIGSSYIKAILKYSPASLVVVDTNENALAELTRDLRASSTNNLPKDFITYPMDYSSTVFEKMFINRKGFDYVANFSAHKHVRSEKDIYSIEALLRNNVINAKKFMELLAKYPPEAYFCVSTDKAANPVNIMGASKRIMEDVIFSYSDIFPVKTARFANVAFSNGSLPYSFIERINKRQPISAPMDVKRYFVSPEESGQICMLSCILGSNRDIFFPKLEKNQMVTFDEIARKYIEYRGFDVCECTSETEAIEKSKLLCLNSKSYPVFFSESDTSGEKPYEEFYIDSEQIDMNRFNSLGVIVCKSIPEKKCIDKLINDIENVLSFENVTKKDIINVIKKYIPSFEHIETGKMLDNKM